MSRRVRWFRVLALLSCMGLAAGPAATQEKESKAVALPKSAKGAQRAPACEPGPDLPGVQCMAALQKTEEKALEQSYRAALARMPDNDAWDARRNRGQLEKAQAAWVAYRSEHCSMVGGQEGGSNMAITFASQLCESRLARERIRYLRSVGAAR